MSKCRYCELKDEHGGDYFAMHNFNGVSEDAEG